MMSSQKKQLFSLLCLSLLLLILSGLMGMQAAEASRQLNDDHHPSKKLFIFGDSYADTGNTGKNKSSSWKQPYGITFPGKPTGRFSDGRVLTDFIAKYMRLKSPIPHKFKNVVRRQYLMYGMNFAVGGTGLFDTSFPGPNMTTQIDSFEQLIKESVYTPLDLVNSIVLVTVAGNDYNHYLVTNGSSQGVPSFISSVVKQTTTNLIRLQTLGVKRIVVGGLQALGCLPQFTAETMFQRCNSTFNDLVAIHNNLLNQSVTRLNQESKNHSTVVILDIYDSFMTVLTNPSRHNIKEQFKPCCVGISREYSCGSIDENNVKKYTVCENPNSAFFWDMLHPTQAGWKAVYSELKVKALHQLLN